MVDVQEGVESYNACRVSLQVRCTVSYLSQLRSQTGVVSAKDVFCVSGIICITWLSIAGEGLCCCRGKRRAKSKPPNHLV